MATAVQTSTITTKVPARLDRLPWSKFHNRVLLGLGTVWVLDGLEVTMVGTVASRLTQPDSGIHLTTGDIGLAGAFYILGACLGALFFGYLTDRFGRKKLFMLTLGVYIAATVATAFSWTAWWFFLARFVTGSGIGGEYAAINSAIDELIPARARGRVDLIINGTYWLGSVGGSALAILFLDRAILPAGIGWRLSFLVGMVPGLTILLVGRHVPESPRWLFIHGRQKHAEQVVDEIEHDVTEDTGQPLDEVHDSITVRQRRTIPFTEIARTAFTLYPKRAMLGFSLFVGQAFIYNGVTFNLGTLFSTYYGISSSFVPVFVIIYAAGNFLGPVTLGRLFDTIGRKPMISGTYLGSALVTIPMALLFLTHAVGPWGFVILIVITFFLASAGASAAYLTVSEIFPMETRAMAIAFFYAIGTAVGGIAGPLLFGQLIASHQRPNVAIAFFIGAAVMALGGIAELLWGVKAEGQTLEDIAKPLTAQEADQPGTPESTEGAVGTDQYRQRAQRMREQAEQARASAAEHRAAALEASTSHTESDAEADAEGDDNGARVEQVLAQRCELHASELDERAAALALLADAKADADQDGEGAPALRHRAAAAEHRADACAERGRAIVADEAQARRRTALADAADQLARAREQRAEAAEARQSANDGDAVSAARATMHEAWAGRHEELAAAHEAQSAGETINQHRHERLAAQAEQFALAAEQRLVAAEHRASANQLHDEQEPEPEQEQDQPPERTSTRHRLTRAGLRRFRPGPGTLLPSARLGGLDISRTVDGQAALDAEVEILRCALTEHGPTDREELARLVGARYWGPGRFGAALRTAVAEGAARRLSRRTYAPPDSD